MKDKKDKKDKFKNREEREEELGKLGLSEEIEGISEFNKYCKEYVEKDISWSGKIKLNGTKRILEAILPRKKIVKGILILRYDETI